MNPPLTRPVTAARPAPQNSSSSKLPQSLLILLLAVNIGTTAIGWMMYQHVVKIDEHFSPSVVGTVGQPGPIANTRINPAAGVNPGFGAQGATPGGGRRGGRGGMSVANLAQTLGINLDANQTTQLQSLIDQRTQAQTDARANGVQADTSTIDDQIATVLGIDPQQLQGLLGAGGRGGRRGGGGGGGGPGGGGGFGGGGGGFGGGGGGGNGG